MPLSFVPSVRQGLLIRPLLLLKFYHWNPLKYNNEFNYRVNVIRVLEDKINCFVCGFFCIFCGMAHGSWARIPVELQPHCTVHFDSWYIWYCIFRCVVPRVDPVRHLDLSRHVPLHRIHTQGGTKDVVAACHLVMGWLRLSSLSYALRDRLSQSQLDNLMWTSFFSLGPLNWLTNIGQSSLIGKHEAFGQYVSTSSNLRRTTRGRPRWWRG